MDPFCFTRFFSLEKKVYINFVPKSVRHPPVHVYVCTAVTFLVNASPPKRLDVATANYAGA